MTTEEKARAYDEALEKAKKIKSKILSSHLSTESCKAVSEYIDEIIPELRESKNEKISRLIYCIVRDVTKAREILHANGLSVYEALSYLEKQKESLHIPETCKENTDSFTNEDERIRKEILSYFNSEDIANQYVTEERRKRWTAWLEKYKEIIATPLDWNDYKDKPVEIWNAYIHGKTVGFERGKEAVKNNPSDYGLGKQKEPEDKGEISDGYHTFNELYYYRMLYNAAFFNLLPKEWVHKSKKHHDGEECFGGGWFIVMANLPTGQISNHYELKNWVLFQIPEKEIADEWDGHTPQEAAERLNKYLQNKYLRNKQKEQKPVEKQDSSGLTDLERAIHRGFFCAGVENVPVGIIKETAKDCLAHMPVEWSDYKDKIDIPYCSSEPEWSEEEKKFLQVAISCTYDRGYLSVSNWLKSIRPSWKPSEEQTKALESAKLLYRDGLGNKEMADILESIEKQLKNL